MKKFDKLAQNITEEEYRNNGRFHYSDIAGYARKGFSYIVSKEKEESESLSFGSVVDCIVTQGMDEFASRYYVERDFDISANQKKVANDLADLGYERIEDVDPEIILSLLDTMGLYKNFKEQTKVAKIIEECKDYYAFRRANIGKTPVDFQMYNDAIDVANKVLTSDNCKMFFTGTESGIDKFKQLKFDGTIDGIPVTCMVDSLYIDHNEKKIWPIDLKTTCAGYEWEFPKSFVKWRYDIQARLYSRILRQVMDSDEDYKDYRLMGFVFVYASRLNKTPLIWTFDKNLDEGDITIECRNGYRIILEDFTKPLKEMALIKEKEMTVPIGISMTDGNDILSMLDYSRE